jgi:membrane protein YdbS with pleckstrin-like domain
MPSIDQQLAREERVCYRTRLHWIVLVGPFIVSAVCGLVGLLLIAVAVIFWMDNDAIQSAFLNGILALQGAAWVTFLGLLYRALTEVAITNRRVLKSRGLIKRTTVQMSLPEVQSVDVRQGPLGQILDFGSIVVVGAGKTAAFRYVSQPFELRRRMEEEVAKAKNVSRRAAA